MLENIIYEARAAVPLPLARNAQKPVVGNKVRSRLRLYRQLPSINSSTEFYRNKFVYRNIAESLTVFGGRA